MSAVEALIVEALVPPAEADMQSQTRHPGIRLRQQRVPHRPPGTVVRRRTSITAIIVSRRPPVACLFCNRKIAVAHYVWGHGWLVSRSARRRCACLLTGISGM